MSPGSSSTGMRLMVASAAPVTMFVAPGPIDVVQANVCSRFFMLGIGHRRMHHRLFVAALVVAELGRLMQRLADSGHVAVPEDAQAAGEERLLDAVPLDGLVSQEVNQRLGGG